MAPITIYASTMSGITWRAVTGKAVSEHLLMIEISKAGKRGLLLEESRPWDATCKVWRCPRPSGIPKYLWALIEQKLRQIEPLPMPGPVAVPAGRPWRGHLPGGHPLGPGPLPGLPGDGADRSPPP
jgi:hypothetical protein